MSNNPFLLKGAGISKSGLQGMLLAVLLAFLPFQANAQISNADAQALLQRHNQDRAAAPKPAPALCLNQKLMTAAENHCQDMATHNFFSHTGSSGSDIRTRIDRTGYSAVTYAENIAGGYPSVAEVMNGWENSSGHYQNIVNGSFKEVGFARCGANLWVANFAAPPASGQTNCTNGTTTTASTTTTTPAATKPLTNQAVYDQCKTFTDGWHFNAASNLYRTYWNNSCYQYDGNTGSMYILRKTATGYKFVLTQ